jgi:hypothetical protein
MLSSVSMMGLLAGDGYLAICGCSLGIAPLSSDLATNPVDDFLSRDCSRFVIWPCAASCTTHRRLLKVATIWEKAMRKRIGLFFLAIAFSMTFEGCKVNPLPAPSPEMPAAVTQSTVAPPSALDQPTPAPVTPTPVTPTLTVVQPIQPPLPVTIQEGNTLPQYSLQPRQSNELEDNRMGVMIGGLTGGGWKPGEPWDYAWMSEQVTSRGLKRLRISIDNLDAGSPDLDWSIPQYTIDPSHDTLITLLAQNGVTMTYVLTFWDKDTWPGGQGAPCPRFKDQAEIDRYLQFVQFIVHHFKDRIEYYEIWNEPDAEACPQRIEVADYINLVRQAVPVIRQEYPEARIVVGSTTCLAEPYTQEYLFTILRSDIMPLVDVVSWHAMYGTSTEFQPEYYASYPALVQQIRDTAAAYGFMGEYEADELTWFTFGGYWDGWSQRYSDTIAAKYTVRSVIMHLGMDITAGIGSALIFDQNWVSTPFAVRNLATLMAGARANSFPVDIDTEAENPVSYTFSLTNGDFLIAYWTNGTAVDDDPGIPATINAPGMAGFQVTGIDVLAGFEQQLVAEDEAGDLVIRDLLIKDYPIFLRLSDLP